MWSQGESAKTGEARTTCELEALHKCLNKQIERYPSKKVWHCMSMIKEEIGRGQMDMTRVSRSESVEF
jgi:hypothetical protein